VKTLTEGDYDAETFEIATKHLNRAFLEIADYKKQKETNGNRDGDEMRGKRGDRRCQRQGVCGKMTELTVGPGGRGISALTARHAIASRQSFGQAHKSQKKNPTVGKMPARASADGKPSPVPLAITTRSVTAVSSDQPLVTCAPDERTHRPQPSESTSTPHMRRTCMQHSFSHQFSHGREYLWPESSELHFKKKKRVVGACLVV
jgi:hypothetical protein